jgi:predicted nucleotidyltransferase
METIQLQAIEQTLREIEAAQGFRILYACESGSRAWGFASRDSDFDVRYIFVWPRDEYLKVHAPPEYHHDDFGDLDMTGWELCKALHHFGKSNASFYEWLGSPIVYFDAGLRHELQQLMPHYFQTPTAAHHYLGLARQLWPGEVSASINGKKLLYVLRATLAARWILQYKTAPPVPFIELLPIVDNQTLRAEIDNLVKAKKAAIEADALRVSAALREFVIATRIDCEEQSRTLAVAPVNFDVLDTLCRHILLAEKVANS